MAEDFEKTLLAFTTPEYAIILNDAYDLLTDLNYTEHTTAINNILMLVDTVDNSSTLSIIETTLVDFLDDYLAQHEILLLDVPINEYLPFAEMLANFDNYGDPITIMDIVNAGESPEAIVAELLPLFTLVDKDEYLLKIDSVSDSLIDKITEIMQIRASQLISEGYLAESSEDNVRLDVIRERTRAHLQSIPDSFIKYAIADGSPLAMMPEDYVLGNESILATMPFVQLNDSLLGICLASDIDATATTIATHTLDLARIIFSNDLNKLTQFVKWFNGTVNNG